MSKKISVILIGIIKLVLGSVKELFQMGLFQLNIWERLNGIKLKLNNDGIFQLNGINWLNMPKDGVNQLFNPFEM